ncbi:MULTISPECIES: hypothetical protein [unclassified Arcicella]|uniref:hypothetical protein n=1 Tax=unclassified Arcicella TaxID=2644986 RepID=UPI00285E92A8|nr:MULTISPECIES: hypothetical protein [unclassified Arcicella]MDR6564071.1 hypothetical protein [Arcicella sp. BE51]MDR6813824.1 hypothetical protein [Arcicella sp. BE140]MDR6825136.1 hypothetical protein [Arcicella sp. BE139]
MKMTLTKILFFCSTILALAMPSKADVALFEKSGKTIGNTNFLGIAEAIINHATTTKSVIDATIDDDDSNKSSKKAKRNYKDIARVEARNDKYSKQNNYLGAKESSDTVNWVAQRTDFWNSWIDKCFPAKNWSNTTFQTIGRNYNDFKQTNPILDSEMKAMYNTLADANNYLPGVINSGAENSDPVKVTVAKNEILYKIVYKGGNINSPSPYYLSESEYNWIKANPSQLEQKLGLPLSSVSAEYDVFTIKSLVDDNVIFQSFIAPTKQFANATPNTVYNTPGGKIQSLIINNTKSDLWLKSSTPKEQINPKCLPQIDN